MTDYDAALLLLGDGRFPAGGYAHSGGLEAAVTSGGVRDIASLEAFLNGRVATAGYVAAAFAAAACHAYHARDEDRLEALGPELDARIPSPAQRAVSHRLGRQLARALETIHPDSRLAKLGPSPHQPIVFGVAAAGFGLGPREAALVALHDGVAAPATAAVRLLSLDPLGAHAALARMAPLLNALADAAAAVCTALPEELPAAGAPLLDLGAEHHAVQGVRLFAS